MTSQEVAELQAALQGVSLPAEKAELVAYLGRQPDGARLAAALVKLPDREYRSLDEVGEALLPVQPQPASDKLMTPKPESGEPPGGDDYTNPNPEPGAVEPSK
ncbi:MAG: hypothetical protein QOE36_3584 [Gaiellaceae bacterium]|jgi:hypothetical protein|nr:hypothetical protein [Gaiellaceae bacterium]